MEDLNKLVEGFLHPNEVIYLQGRWENFESPCVVAPFGSLDLLKWMHQKNAAIFLDSMICALAAHHGHLHILNYTFTNGCQFSVTISREAAINGHLKAVKWLYKKGCPFYKYDIMGIAAVSGNLSLVKWLRKKDLNGILTHPRQPPELIIYTY